MTLNSTSLDNLTDVSQQSESHNIIKIIKLLN